MIKRASSIVSWVRGAPGPEGAMSRLNIGIAVIVLTAALSAAGYAAAKAVEAMAVVTVVDMVGHHGGGHGGGIFMAAAFRRRWHFGRSAGARSFADRV